MKNLHSLNLRDNPIGNNSIKLLAENSRCLELQSLNLSNMQMDHQGIKHLALNDSWKRLQELEALDGCNLDQVGIVSLRRNKTFRVALGRNYVDKGEYSNQIFLKEKKNGQIDHSFSIRHPISRRFTDQEHLEDLTQEHLTYLRCHRRGGFPQGDQHQNSNYTELLEKFNRYKEKILNDSALEKELSLYIDVHASSGLITNDNKNHTDNKTSDLALDFSKHFLNQEDSLTPKILLLTGKAGIGKSLFCNYLQREILSTWRDPLHQESNDIRCFPVFLEVSASNNPKSEILSETLAHELALSEEEIQQLRTSEPSNLALPRLLFILDGYESFETAYSRFYPSTSGDESKSNTKFVLSVLNTIEADSWKNAKFIITCREEYLNDEKDRELLYEFRNDKSNDSLPDSRRFMRRKIEPFTNEQIACLLKKYCFVHQNFHFWRK